MSPSLSYIGTPLVVEEVNLTKTVTYLCQNKLQEDGKQNIPQKIDLGFITSVVPTLSYYGGVLDSRCQTISRTFSETQKFHG